MEPKQLNGRTIAQQSAWKYYSTAAKGGPSEDGPGSEASQSAAGADQPHDQQQQYGADRRIDDLRHQSAADGDAELGEAGSARPARRPIPTRMSPMMPKPVPRTILPASQPAIRPTTE